MRVLVSQPNHESGMGQLKEELQQYGPIVDAVLYPEGYVADWAGVQALCSLAAQYNKLMITSYKDAVNKDRALMIDASGKIILDRTKSLMQEVLYSPSAVKASGLSIGYLLCVEILQGFSGLEGQAEALDFIAHPIGVGMFSEEQFDEWITEASKIAVKYNCPIIGTSHADGSYRNCGISIPISYCIDSSGKPLYISKSDIRSRMVDLSSGSVELLGSTLG